MKIKIVKNPVRFNLAHFIGDVVEVDYKVGAEIIAAGVGEAIEESAAPAEKPAKKTAKK